MLVIHVLFPTGKFQIYHRNETLHVSSSQRANSTVESLYLSFCLIPIICLGKSPETPPIRCPVANNGIKAISIVIYPHLVLTMSLSTGNPIVARRGIMHNGIHLIKTFPQFVDAIADMATGELEIKNLTFDNDFGCRIKLEGEDWDGRIDTVLAKLLIDIEVAVKSSFRDYGYQNEINELLDEIKHIKVKAVVNFGCTDYKIFFGWIERVLKTMKTEKSKLIALGLISATIMGIILGHTAINTHERIITKAKDEETKQLMAKALVDVAKYENKLTSPVRYFAGRLKKDDRVHFEEATDSLTKDQIKNMFGEIEPDFRTTVNVDGQYIVRKVDLKVDEATFDVEGQLIRASMKTLEDSGRKHIADLVGDGINHREAPAIDLKVSLHIEGSKTEIYIIGIGAPRKESVNILTALGSLKLKSIAKEQLQAQLPMSDD